MSAIIAGGLAEAIDAQVDRYREKTSIARLARINSAMNRDIPYEEHSSDSALTGILGALYEVAIRPPAGSDSSGEGGGATDSASGEARAQGGGQRQAASGEVVTTTAGAGAGQARGRTQGQAAQGGRGNDAGTGQGTAGGAGDSGAGGSWLRSAGRYAIPWLLGTGLLGTGVGYAANWYFSRGGDSRIEQPAEFPDFPESEYPLGEWIEGNNWHLGD